MKTIIDSRGTGKTTKLFELARKTNSMILTTNSRALREKARNKGYTDLEIIGFGNLDHDNFSLGKDVLVDNAEHVLQKMLNDFYGLNMTGFTATIEEN